MRLLFLLEQSVLSKDSSRCLTPRLTFAFEMQRGGTVHSLYIPVPGHQLHWWWQTHHWELKMGYLVSGVRETHQCSRKVHFHVIHTIDCLYRLVQYTTSCKGSLKISSKFLVPAMWLVAELVQLPILRCLCGIGACQVKWTDNACPAGAWEARGPRHGPCSNENRQAALDRSLHCGSNHRERSVFSFWSKQFWLAFAMGNWTILRSLKEINPFIVGWTL